MNASPIAASRPPVRVRSVSCAMTLAWGELSDTGHVRSLNEDSLCAAPPVFAIADGMGGHHGGDVASAIAVGSLSTFEPGQAIDEAVLRRAVVSANRLIFERSDNGERVMGTTISGIAVAADARPSLLVFNVGDSRTYLLEHGELRQVTRDHSHVQELYEAGAITFDEMATHPDRNIVTRALGVDPTVDVDVSVVPAQVGQRWMACSDGLSGEIAIEKIRDCLAMPDAQDAADALIAATLAGPARDNVSVVVVDVVDLELLDDPDRTDPRRGTSVVGPSPTAATAPIAQTGAELIDVVPFDTSANNDHTSERGIVRPQVIDDVPGNLPSPPDHVESDDA